MEEDAHFGYDVRRGAAAYSPIVGTIGGFVVTGVVLVFGIAAHHKAGQPVEHAELLGRATALLVLGLIACLLSAFALGAIGAERGLTPNLTPAILYAGVSTAIGIVAIVVAFEVLAAIYLPQTKELFALISTGAAVAASVLVALVLNDAWLTPQPSGHWLSTPRQAAWWGTGLAGCGSIIIIGAAALYFEDLHINVSTKGLHWLIGIGIGLSLLSGLGSTFRSIHSGDGKGRAIRRAEAIVVMVILNAYLATSILLMP